MKRKSPTLQLSRLEKNEIIVSVNSVKDSDKFIVYTQLIEEEFKVKDIPVNQSGWQIQCFGYQ